MLPSAGWAGETHERRPADRAVAAGRGRWRRTSRVRGRLARIGWLRTRFGPHAGGTRASDGCAVPRTPRPRKQLRGVKSDNKPLEPTPYRETTPSAWGQKYLAPALHPLHRYVTNSARGSPGRPPEDAPRPAFERGRAFAPAPGPAGPVKPAAALPPRGLPFGGTEDCFVYNPHGAACAGTASWERSCPARILTSGGFAPVRAGRTRTDRAWIPAFAGMTGPAGRPRTDQAAVLPSRLRAGRPHP